MKNITELISELEANYSSIIAPDESQGRAFPLVCYIDRRDACFINIFQQNIPNDLQIWWENVSNAVLFKDVLYGQWGLNIVSIEMSKILSERQINNFPMDFYDSDVIIGEFYGDLELLFVNCKEGNDFGKVYVALEIDHRKDWPCVANNFTEFIQNYINTKGDKFWTTRK